MTFNLIVQYFFIPLYQNSSLVHHLFAGVVLPSDYLAIYPLDSFSDFLLPRLYECLNKNEVAVIKLFRGVRFQSE